MQYDVCIKGWNPEDFFLIFWFRQLRYTNIDEKYQVL